MTDGDNGVDNDEDDYDLILHQPRTCTRCQEYGTLFLARVTK
jgi:hypothetical protein